MTRINLSASVSIAVLASAACTCAQADIVTDWNFGLVTAVSPDNNPSPTTGSGTASSLGMTNSYTYTKNGSNVGTGSVTLDDVTNDSPVGTADGSTIGNGNVWRVRGVAGTGTTGSANNGWNNSAPQYSQGAEFDVNTTGFSNIGLSFNWAATTQGVGEPAGAGTPWTARPGRCRLGADRYRRQQHHRYHRRRFPNGHGGLLLHHRRQQ